MTDPSARPEGAPVLADETPSVKPGGTRLGLSNYLGLVGALGAMVALFSILSSHFLTYDTFSTIANQIPDLVVMSVGMTFVLIVAGIDLSVGSVLALSASVVSVAALQWHWPPVPAALAGMAAHEAPSQCSTTPSKPLPCTPTAHTSFGPVPCTRISEG